MKRRELILNPYFIVGLIVLLLNDFYLKYQFGNFVTGKLSDFAGLLIFPMFVTSIIPSLRKKISLLSGIGFFIWKLPLFTPVIDLINQFSFIPIHRVIDYSDYIALLILPLSHYLINNSEGFVLIGKRRIISFLRLSLLGVSFCAFCATSMPRVWEAPQGTIYIDKSYTVKLPKDSVINTIKQLGYNCDFYQGDTLGQNDYRTFTIDYYQTDNIILTDDGFHADTILNVKYTLTEIKPSKTKLTIINVTLPKEGHIQDWKNLKRLSKRYDSLLKEGLIKKID